MNKSPEAFRTISEVAEWLDVPTHVLRFWESRFTQVKPVKRAGGRRYYRPADMELLGGIKRLLHEDGLTIRGVQKLLREEGVRHVADMSPAADSPVGPRGDTPETPAALDVPALPPRGEVVDFAPETGPAPTDDSDKASDSADDVLSRWPFADDASDNSGVNPSTEQALDESQEAVSSDDIETDTTTADEPSDPVIDEDTAEAESVDDMSAAPSPMATPTEITPQSILALIRATGPEKLNKRGQDLLPLVARLTELHDRLAR